MAEKTVDVVFVGGGNFDFEKPIIHPRTKEEAHFKSEDIYTDSETQDLVKELKALEDKAARTKSAYEAATAEYEQFKKSADIPDGPVPVARNVSLAFAEWLTSRNKNYVVLEPKKKKSGSTGSPAGDGEGSEAKTSKKAK